jgi:uncharacterized lipoprotein YehR (DUF1307 family)
MKTMKRIFLSLAVVSISAVLLFGCGNTQTDTGTAAASEPAADVNLSTANDTFSLPLLPQLLEAPDAAIVEMFGESENSTEDADGNVTGREYSGTLFGQDIRILTHYEDDVTVQVDVTFDSTEASIDQLADALSDELGTATDEYRWESDGAVFALNDVDGTLTLSVTLPE